jgi:hypothetical protein
MTADQIQQATAYAKANLRRDANGKPQNAKQIQFSICVRYGAKPNEAARIVSAASQVKPNE